MYIKASIKGLELLTDTCTCSSGMGTKIIAV